jgi:hypothetical protein
MTEASWRWYCWRLTEADADADDRGVVGDCVSGELKAGADAGDGRMVVTKERPGADAGDCRYSGADIGGGIISWWWWLMGKEKGPELRQAEGSGRLLSSAGHPGLYSHPLQIFYFHEKVISLRPI